MSSSAAAEAVPTKLQIFDGLQPTSGTQFFDDLQPTSVSSQQNFLLLQMEAKDSKHIWERSRRGIEVLDAHCVGEWFLQLCVGDTFNPS